MNPGYSEIEHDIYNPCVKGSRLGMPLPSLALKKKGGRVVILREFGYNDFKCRLGRQ